MSDANLRAIAVVERVAASALPVSLKSITESTRMSRATAYRMVTSLCDAGVLLREPRGAGFSMGARMEALALQLMSGGSFRQARHSILQTLVAQVGETCNFTTFHAGAVLYVDRVESEWPLRLMLKPGSSTPIHCTSSGKIYLSQMPAIQRKRYLYGAPIPRYTDWTITDPLKLDAELGRVRRQRYATDDQGYLAGLISVAVPVHGIDRVVIGTVSVHAPLARLPLERAVAFLPQIRRAAADLGSAYRRIGASSTRARSGSRRASSRGPA